MIRKAKLGNLSPDTVRRLKQLLKESEKALSEAEPAGLDTYPVGTRFTIYGGLAVYEVTGQGDAGTTIRATGEYLSADHEWQSFVPVIHGTGSPAAPDKEPQ